MIAEMSKTAAILVTDLDNTLYDWFGFWHSSFTAMFNEVARISGLDRQLLEKEFRTVFQKHGTSEYAFAIQELPSLKVLHGENADLPKLYSAAIDAYRDARRKSLHLYPGVMQTLTTLRARGCLLIGYTESLAFYTKYRLRRLGLDELLDFLYSPPDHEVPSDASRHYPAEHYDLRRTVHRETP